MIFSGSETLFFLLGFLTAMIIIGLYTWNKTYRFKWSDWTLLLLGFILEIFALAWSVSSVLEGEPRAASMGLVFFAIPGLIILTLSRRLILKRIR
jgi:biotin transporter BioY